MSQRESRSLSSSDAETSGWQWSSGSSDALDADACAKNLKRWQEFIEKHDQSDEKIHANKGEVKDWCRKHGLPAVHRTKLWFAFSGGYRMRKSAPEGKGYANLLQVAQDPAAKNETNIEQIEKDLWRTGLPAFKRDQGEVGQQMVNKLRRVLLAYSVYDPLVGYCQAMNFIAGYLLMHMSETNAFWTLAAIINTMMPKGYYDVAMIGMHCDTRVFAKLVEERLPKCHAHLQKLDIPVQPIATIWFMSLFVHILPLHILEHMWDVFFLEGSKILFRVALSVIKIKERSLLQMTTFEGAYQCLMKPDVRRRTCARSCQAAAEDRNTLQADGGLDALVPTAFDSFLKMFSMDHIVKLRKIALADIEAEQLKLKAAKEANRKRASMVVKAKRASMIGGSVDDVAAVRAAMESAVQAAAAEMLSAEPAAPRVLSSSPSLAPIDEAETNEIEAELAAMALSLRLRIPIFRKQKWLERLCRTCCNMRLTQRSTNACSSGSSPPEDFEAKALEPIESFSLDETSLSTTSEIRESGGAVAEPSKAVDARGSLESASFRGRKPRRVSMMSYDSQALLQYKMQQAAVGDSSHESP